MDVEQVTARAREVMQQASDNAARARLAYVTGNYDAYTKQIFAEAEKRLNDAYDELNGPRDEPATDTGTV